MAEKAQAICSKHSKHFMAALEDFIIDKYLYRRVLEAAAGAGLRIDPQEVAGVRSVKELRERAFNTALQYIEENPGRIDPDRILQAVETDGMTGRIVGTLVSLLAGANSELTYEDAVAIADHCGLRRTRVLLTKYPNVSKIVIALLNALIKAYRASQGTT